MASKHTKRCSISLVFREAQSKTKSHHYIAIRKAKIKKTNANVSNDIGATRAVYTLLVEMQNASTALKNN